MERVRKTTINVTHDGQCLGWDWNRIPAEHRYTELLSFIS
jgi:hypothetical protein